jgi:hypothetical protein
VQEHQCASRGIDVAEMGGKKTRANLSKCDAPVVSLRRHSTNCRISGHGKRAELESDFVSWKSPARIATEYRLGNRAISLLLSVPLLSNCTNCSETVQK